MPVNSMIRAARDLVRRGYPLVLSRIAGARTPVSVTMSVTGQCAAACVYCLRTGERQPDLSPAEMSALIPQLARQGCRIFTLSGGEPLLRPDIVEIARQAHGHGLYVRLITNGHALRARREILRYLDNVVISLDGDEPAHDLLRGAGTFARVMDACRLLDETAAVPLTTMTVLTARNVGDVDFVLQFAKTRGHGAQFIFIDDTVAPSLRPSPEQYERAINRLIRAKQQGLPVMLGDATLAQMKRQGGVTIPRGPGWGPPCLAGRMHCFISNDGFVYPCCKLTDVTGARNVRDAGFAAAFRHVSALTSCIRCRNAVMMDINYTYSLTPSAVWNAFRTTFMFRQTRCRGRSA